MKKKLSRLLAVFLSMLCLLTILPSGLSLEAEAAVTGGVQAKISEIVNVLPTGSYFTTTGKAITKKTYTMSRTSDVIKKHPKLKNLNLNWKKVHGAYQCCAFAHFAFRYIFGNEFTWSNGASKSSSIEVNSNSNLNNFFAECKVGDVLQWTYPGETYGHYAIFLGYTKNKELRVYDCNIKGECMVTYNHDYTYDWLKRKCGVMWRYRAKNYDKINGIVPSITGVQVTDTTNTTGTLKVNLSHSVPIEKWSYFLSTNKSDVANVNGTVSSNHKSTATMDCVRAADWSSSPKLHASDSITLKQYQGKPLKPGTTYYYKALACIGGKWYQSGVTSFTTDCVAPAAPTIRVAEDSRTIGIGDQATVLWDGVSGADTYNITVTDAEGNTVQEKTGITGATCVLDAFTADGVYNVTATAVNGAGSTAGNTAEITVMPNSSVTFYDTIGEKEIAVVSVPYGHSADPPKNPVQDGHTFSKWDKSFDKVTGDMTVNTIYDRNSYTVKFIDSFTNEVLKSQTVKYKDEAIAPDVTAPANYELTAWSNDFSSVESDMDVYTVYGWTDGDHSITIDEASAVKKPIVTDDGTENTGYDVTVKFSNHINKILTGRLVVVLKSAEGTILTETESNAFALDKSEDGTPIEKSISLEVVYPEFASKFEVYAINSYQDMGKMSLVYEGTIDNSEQWSDWIPYEGDTAPYSDTEGYIVETDTRTTEEKNYYRYNIKETATSYATSMSGFTQDGYELEKASTGTIDYVASWPSGFNTSNGYYTKYNKTPKSASESATQKIVIDSTSTISYLYWHWCRGASLGTPYNRTISYSKTSTFSKFHCFNSATNSSTFSDDAYKYSNADACTDTYWWGKLPVKRQTYTTYNKLYNYYSISDYTDWIEYTGDIPVAVGDTVGTNKTINAVGTMTEPGTEYNVYRYKITADVAEPVIEPGQVKSVGGNVGAEFAGKPVTVWVYKYAQASDYTTEYAATTTVGEDGSIYIENAVLRETPTVESGDYTIAASVEGQERAIIIGKIEAPKAQYTVTFYDYDQTVIDEQVVTEGDTAVLPDESLLHVPEGSRFTNWSESVVNVKSNMSVYPESETAVHTVAVVNWEVQTVELKKFNYGAELIVDTVPEGKDGFVTEWVVKNADDEYVTIDEFTEAGGTVTGDMVVVTRSTPEQHTVTILDADKEVNIEEKLADEAAAEELDVAVTEVVTNGSNIDFSQVQETIEEAEELIFLGWIDAYTGEAIETTEVTESMTIYPSYVFAENTDAAYADIETGEYTEAQTVTLTSETENAVIWYTTDGSDPKISDTAIEYTAPITVSESCTLRYYAAALGMNDSEENTSTYAINTAGNPVYHVVTIVMPALEGIEASFPNPIWLVKDGSTLPVNVIETIDGYEVGELYFDEACTEEFLFDLEVIGESMSLYAKYTPKNYTVTFVDHDDAVLDVQTVPFSTAATAPETGAREGYVFVGWDTDFDSVSADITVKAQYITEAEYAEVTLKRTKLITLNPGSDYPLHKFAVITPEAHADYELEWTTSDATVVTVDENGVVSAVGAGTATVTVTIPYTGASASVDVKVTPDSDTSIVLRSDAVIGFDSERNVRGITAGENTVAEILAQFENENLTVKDGEGNVLAETDLVATGCTICLYDGEELLDSVKTAVTGDFNCDGIFDNKDIVMVNQHVLGQREADAIQMIAIDANGDGTINNRDCSVLLRVAAGLEA